MRILLLPLIQFRNTRSAVPWLMLGTLQNADRTVSAWPRQPDLACRSAAFLLLALSFAGKAAFRLVVFHNPNYWESGYSLYFDLADTFLRTGSFYRESDSSATGYRTFSKPLYPLLIAAVCKLTHYSGEAFVLVEALISTLTVVLVYAITVRLAPPPAAFLSALLYAFYPYAFYHDTQLQENVLWNALALATVACLLAAIDGKRGYLFFLAGTLAGVPLRHGCLTRRPLSSCLG